MGRKLSVEKLHPDVVEFINRLIRENRHSLDELYDAVREQFPALDKPPSRVALWRWRKGIDEINAQARLYSTIGSVFITELGEDKDDKAGALLAQAVTTLTTRAAFGELQKENADISDVLALARAAKAAQQTRGLSLIERQSIARAAREKAAETAVKEVRAAGLSDETAELIRQKILGVS